MIFIVFVGLNVCACHISDTGHYFLVKFVHFHLEKATNKRNCSVFSLAKNYLTDDRVHFMWFAVVVLSRQWNNGLKELDEQMKESKANERSDNRFIYIIFRCFGLQSYAFRAKRSRENFVHLFTISFCVFVICTRTHIQTQQMIFSERERAHSCTRASTENSKIEIENRNRTKRVRKISSLLHCRRVTDKTNDE